eukprot:471669-Prymnesium_polylepis.1
MASNGEGSSPAAKEDEAATTSTRPGEESEPAAEALPAARRPSSFVGDNRSFSRRSGDFGASSRARRDPMRPMPPWLRRCVQLAGWRPGRTCWGLDPWDLGLSWIRREEWYESVHQNHDHGPETWWDTPLYEVPKLRHLWGVSQGEVHPGAQELFLDLIFVGV